MRGYPLDEMMGRLSFAEAVYLLLMGELPTPAIGRMFYAMLVSSIDHGVTPPSTLAARNVATSGAPLKDCVAAGILAFGPASRRRHRVVHAVSRLGAGARCAAGRSLQQAAEALVEECVQQKEDAARASATGSTRATRGRRACSRWRSSSSSKASTCG